ncbi:MAG: magnesium transporter [Bacteroidetes bacterium]|nr:MAG: magnesium transporter [Bacteroidota bacterium]
MQFELDKEFVNRISEAVKEQRAEEISNQLADLHPSDTSEVMDQLNFEEASYVFKLLDTEVAVEILADLDEDVRIKLLSTFSPEEIAQPFIEEMASDDAADIVNELPVELKDDVIANIKDEEHAQDIVALLYYAEDTAGGLMAKELINVNINWSIEQCIKEVKQQAEDVKNIYAVYVVNDQDVLLGILSLKKLLITPSSTKVEEVYFKEVISVNTSTNSEEVANVMQKYDIVTLPVIDALGKLVGRITIDDVVDVIQEEAEKDIQMMSGISENVEASDKVWVLTRARLPWLLIGLLGGIISAMVIGIYEEDLKIYPEMALFIPLIAAMAGNAGVQSATIVVQGLANSTLIFDGIVSKLWKELSVALINGIVCSIVILGCNLLFLDSYNLGITVSIALLFVIIFASLFGTLVPLVLDKFKIDPALATGPFVTTVNDIIAIAMYFIIGRLMYTM